ncbi:hypothetical protein EJ04DRAFT_480157 [Polyplosphaeria fusca]|uniref:Matrin-type domain-containing protein n=1 Tax=Polyplosphaeria fusca TaxID=682080 RepID=A0A9P4QJK3_9PLEO|nr:hypothetical protein EJ04DRAFT_480157 [Polyplosphaeria fusca]
MLLEDQRHRHEVLERLEDAIAERLREDPKHIRDRLARDHEIAHFLASVESESVALLKLYEDTDGEREKEVRGLAQGDNMESFQKEIARIREFYQKYPDQQAENLEKTYKKRTAEDQAQAIAQIETMFSGEEGTGRFFDLSALHHESINLQRIDGRHLSYLQYLDSFDNFAAIRRNEKLSDRYFQYVKALQEYLESFMRRTKPLENVNKIFSAFDAEFDQAWEKDEVPGWEKRTTATVGPDTNGDAEHAGGLWCTACQKQFANESVYESHLAGKKHKRAAEAAKQGAVATSNGPSASIDRFKERAIAEREFRIKKLAAAMSTERADTKVNVERKQGMTERERQQELEMLYNENPEENKDDGHVSDSEDKIYNPLKLPLAWDGKPIPFWLYKLHGLGVEFPCEICGNYTYMGRRAFEKHFNEARHIWGLKALGITNTTLFREITGMKEAQELWATIEADKKKEMSGMENIVEMEDTDGNVMPEKVYRDLAAQGYV